MPRGALIFVCLASAFAADPTAVFSFVKKNCVACHNSSMTSGDVNFTSLLTPESFDARRETWERTVSKLETGQMPPPTSPKPPAAEVTAVTKWLTAEFARQDRTAKPDPGRVTARRLNRNEYNNTIRDLLGVEIRPADNFPNDETAFGFDNIGDALTLPSVLLEKYLYAAERSVRTAVFGPEKLAPAAVHYSSPVRLNFSRGKAVLPDLTDYDLTGLSTLHSMHNLHRFPVDGEYSFRVVLNGHRPNQSEPVHPALWIDGKIIREFEVDATDLEGQIVETRTAVTAGEHLVSVAYLKAYHGLPPSYNGPEPSKRPAVALISARGKLTEQDIETLRKYGTRIKTDAIETRVDHRFESLDIGGPFTQPSGPKPQSTKLVFVCAEQTDACASKIVSTFARRAFRRPVPATEAAPFVNIYTLARKQGDSFQEGIAAALQGILVSPHFLFRIERDRTPAASRAYGPVDDFELASRLSYFLWATMPDSELLAAAEQRKLRQPAALAAQVRRMLRDPKSRALVENFAGQWLQFRNIDVVKPDSEKFREFDDSLRYSMRRETELFLENLIREDRSVLEIVDAKHSYLDERLARFYGVPGIRGPEFRKVDMSGTRRGGGVLAQGSILTISSYSTRTSPVLRGKWILENLLDSPPPPPPPAVPSLDETKMPEGASLRQQMEQHRKNPACASCHSRLDPLGFGLENFNAIGQWRDKDGAAAVDASGTLGTRSFTGPSELKGLVLSDRDAFVRGLTGKLLTYALGRGLERPDRRIVNDISSRLPARNYSFSALVLEIVESLPFQNRRVADPLRTSVRTGDSAQ